VLEGIEVHGYRRTTTVPGKLTGTGRAVVVTDEYWYSEELRLNVLEKHSDARTGDLTVTVTELKLNEPPAELFEVPPGYKVVDVTPPQ
jgi:hypothetical protein